MTRKVYMVGQLKQSVQVADLERRERFVLPCTWADGMIGAFAVFGTREAAEKYQNKQLGYPIVEFEVDEPTKQ
jgi:hypothetical protein